MSIGHLSPAIAVRSEVAAGPAFDLLVALAAASADLASAPADLRPVLADVGDTAGESWLNLFGIPLDLGTPYDAARLAQHVAVMDPVELRRHLLGRYAWSWCTLGGTDTIEAAAEGNAAAARSLLQHERYYAGQAKASLSTLLRLDPDATRRVIASALKAGARLLGPGDGRLEAAADAASAELEAAPLPEAIERITGGYRYVPEVEADRVLLVPHVQASPWLVLAQHRGARLIVYRWREAGEIEQRVAALGRAIADPRRVEILRLLGQGADGVSGLVAQTGLTRSTVHHHLSQLRDARLVDFEGNARRYRYVLRREAVAEATALLSGLFPGGDSP